MNIMEGILLFMAIVLVNTVPTIEQEAYMEKISELVVSVLGQQEVSSCHLVFLTTQPHSSFVTAILRKLTGGVVTVMADSPDQHIFSKAIWGNSKTCRTLILHVDNTKINTNLTLRLLERTEHWKQSQTKVVVVGARANVKDIFLHHSFRNTVDGIYLAVNPNIFITQNSRPHIRVQLPHKAVEEVKHGVSVYRRCQYCSNGEADVQYLYHWQFSSLPVSVLNANISIFEGEDQLVNFEGRKLKFIAASLFPYVDFPMDIDETPVPIIPYDTVDVRLAETLAMKHNFTYVMLKEPDNSWGEDTNGIWSGLMGYLQREEVDMSTLVASTDSRLKAANFIRAYPTSHVTMISLKAQPLPRYLALIRPFSRTVWGLVMVSVVVAGVMLWLIHWTWSQVTERPDIRVDTALLYVWGALLEVHPKVPTSALSGQVMVGWWLVYCLVIFTGFESELISHLTVNKARTRPPETLEDLVNADGWKWGIDVLLWTGVPLEYFTRHKNPVVVEIYKHLEVIETHKGLRKMLREGYSMFAFAKYIAVEAASYYGDGHGDMPFFISTKSITMYSFIGWGFRLGAPFYNRFNLLTQQLDAAGIMTLWVDQVMNQRIKDNRHKAELTGGIYYTDKSEGEDRHVALGLDHLQGAFYLLIFGSIVSLLGLLVEILIRRSFGSVTNKMIL